jgi:hypothetical protein
MNPIPLLDVRNGGPVAHARARIHAAAALRNACLGVAAPLGRCLAPIDRLATNWLRRSASAYRFELEHIAAILGVGAVTLNMSYLFACTTQAYEGPDGLPRIRRTLDWPFKGLGEAVEMAWQSGPAGDFYNATWPGAVGVLGAMAPGRFCAVINQAPMQRRNSGGRVGFAFDAILNMRNALASEGGWPPDHLLRYAFETCETFEEAVALIAREPLARPTLFTLAGVKRGEMALIERTESEARILRGPVVVANDWQEPQLGWQARMSVENNELRKAAMRAVAPDAPRFSWVTEPVLNRLTRLAVEMSSAGAGDFVARGYECPYIGGAPAPVTQDFHLQMATLTALAA